MRQLSLFGIILLLLSACSQKQTPDPLYLQELQELGFELRDTLKPFYFGVASGDPQASSVLIWTCVAPDYHQEVEVSWKMATDADMQEVVAEGKVVTDSLKGYVVKAVVEGLQPGTRYYYQFEAMDAQSPVGRTNTLPEGELDSLYLAFASCSNYQFGYFNAYDRIADNDEIFAVLHLGDYIYEYEAGRYGDTTTGRFHIPDREIRSLDDYRKRYAQYRTDPSLQRAHRMHPFITIWDDHELSNNAYRTGAQNHQPEEEGAWEPRKQAAVQAYFEWLPVRDDYKPFLYRSFSLGNLADLLVLEGRLQRSEQVGSATDSSMQDPGRTMLGERQLSWIKDQLKESRARWRVIGNQVVFSDLSVGHIHEDRPKFVDMWSGYPAEQQELTRFLLTDSIDNVLIFTGDFHSSLAAEVALQPLDKATHDPENGRPAAATEFVVHSVNSSNYDEYTSEDTARVVEQMYRDPAYNPHVKYTNMRDHGYVLLRLYPDTARVEYHYIGSHHSRNDENKETAVLRVPSGEARILSPGE